MLLKWLGHACFKLTHNNYSIVIDPYDGNTIPGYRPINAEANEVLCSHGHDDHNTTSAVTLISSDVTSPFTVRTVKSWHDDKLGALRGDDTIHILEADGLRVVHMGDIGCPLTDAQIKEIGKPDLLLIPVGGTFTVTPAEAKEMIEALDAKIVIPMHYKGDGFGYPPTLPVDDFLALMDKNTIKFYNSDSFELSADTNAQIAVLSFKP